VKSLRRLAFAADLVAFAVVMLGSWTRIESAGLTCPDWPMCRGRVIPAMVAGTQWEWTHRLLALVLLPLIVAVCAVAWRHRRQSKALAITGAAITALFLIQVALGAATVALDNSPFSVVLHWGTAMAVIASLTALVVFTGAAERESERRAPVYGMSLAFLVATTLVAFATMCVGAYVSSSGAGLACQSIPGCAGNVVVYTPGQIAQMLHRVLAAATLLLATGTFALVCAKPATSRVRAWTVTALALVCIQVILGLLNVALRLPTDLREVHAANAALVFLAFVTATACAVLDATPQSVPERS
jgi:heme A synthase